MKTSRSRCLANQRGRERSSKWTTHHSEDWWGTFCVHFFVKKTTRGRFFFIKRFLQLAGNGGPPANVSVPTIMDALVMLFLEVKAMLWHFDILLFLSPGSSVAWQALQSGSVHDTKRKPCYSVRFLPGHGELQLREGALGDSHCDANRRRWWEYFSFCNSQLSFQLTLESTYLS